MRSLPGVGVLCFQQTLQLSHHLFSWIACFSRASRKMERWWPCRRLAAARPRPQQTPTHSSTPTHHPHVHTQLYMHPPWQSLCGAGAKDFLVDCLALRQHMELLDPVLSNPRICKAGATRARAGVGIMM